MCTQPSISVLGSSSPFFVGFVEAVIPVADQMPPMRLVLHGRNVENLELIAQFARHHLQSVGWRIESTTCMRQALEGATVVVHQIRYGGWERRTCLRRVLPCPAPIG